jgi:beta-mannosidase
VIGTIIPCDFIYKGYLNSNLFYHICRVKIWNLKTLLIIGLQILMSCSSVFSQSDTLSLNGKWTLSNGDRTIEIEARVPGYVQLDLERNHLLPALFSAGFEEAARNSTRESWLYEYEFELSNQQSEREFIELYFGGIDTYASIFLNEKWVANSGNMFVPIKIDVSGKLKVGVNKLSVRLLSSVAISEKSYQIRSDSLPGGYRVMSRKAQYMFGWDWAPNIPSSGIWQDVSLFFHTGIQAELNNLHCIPNEDYSKAHITGNLNIRSDRSGNYQLSIKANNQVLSQQVLNLNQGINDIEFKGEILNPKLWWTSPLGEPYLYDVTLHVSDDKGEEIWREHRRLGVRKIQLHTEKDSSGNPFYFSLNDKPIYIKGANWVPFHFFPSETDSTGYRSLLALAKSSHFNMLRVWGGGFYEKDIFYDICDELGILVWQDFMFACGMYPGDRPFLAEVEKEAKYQVNRLSTHPCMALWCGNNEIAEGWENWGWKLGLSSLQILQIEEDYNSIFKTLLPRVVEKYHPSMSYHESSPEYGRGNPMYLKKGDAHDWFVWHDMYPFSHFTENIPRFMSEFGFQSYPDLGTIAYFNNENAGELNSILDFYQMHPKGNSIIQKYMSDSYPTPKNEEEMVYLSQLMQGRGIGQAIAAQRVAQPYCMGSMYWQFNDCWPAVSWSSIDFLRKLKAQYYLTKRAYKPWKGFIIPRESQIEVSFVNDQLHPLNVNWTLYEGNAVFKKSIKQGHGTYSSGSSQIISIVPDSSVLYYLLETQVDGVVDREMFFPIDFKNWKIKDNMVRPEVNCEMGQCRVSLRAKEPIVGIQLIVDGLDIEFEDQFLDLYPGAEHHWVFKIPDGLDADSIKDRFKIRGLSPQ